MDHWTNDFETEENRWRGKLAGQAVAHIEVPARKHTWDRDEWHASADWLLLQSEDAVDVEKLADVGISWRYVNVSQRMTVKSFIFIIKVNLIQLIK